MACGEYLERIWPDGCLRPEIVLEFLGDDLLVDIQMGNPVPVHLGRHHQDIVRWMNMSAKRCGPRREDGDRATNRYLFTCAPQSSL